MAKDSMLTVSLNRDQKGKVIPGHSIVDGNIVVVIPLDAARTRSKSGITELLYSTHGNGIVAMSADQRPVALSVNCYARV